MQERRAVLTAMVLLRASAEDRAQRTPLRRIVNLRPGGAPVPTPLRLSDNQLAALMRLAQPLQPQDRDALLRILAYELRDRGGVGDGELHRLVVATIRAHKLYDPPFEGGYAAE